MVILGTMSFGNKMTENAQKVRIAELKVTLHGSKPKVYRRIRLPLEISLYRLHCVLQIAMGWADQSGFYFEIGERLYGQLSNAKRHDSRLHDSRKSTLEQVLATGKFSYIYDYEDQWRHEVVVERTLWAPATEAKVVTCLQAKRACPPEKAGGIEVYNQEVLPILANSRHKLYLTYKVWAGIDFDPAQVDLDAINKALIGVLSRRRIADSI